jgi:F0F1-type ATP synthase gamma subunit
VRCDRREEERVVPILPLTGDRRLAGAFNAQVLRHAFALARRLESEGKRVRWLVCLAATAANAVCVKSPSTSSCGRFADGC